MLRIVDPVVAEGHVAHGRIELPFGDEGVSEGLVQHLGVGVQVGGDGRGGGVQFHPHHVHRHRGVLRSKPDEVARSAARLQDVAAREAEIAQALPHRLHQRGVGVVGVEGGATRSGVVGHAQQGPQLGAFGHELLVAGVEDLGDCSPARPAGQDPLFVRGGRGLPGPQDAQQT